MQTADLLDLMDGLELRGMRSALEETLSEGLKRKHSIHQITGLAAKAEERRVRFIRHQLTTAICRYRRVSIPSSSPAPRSTKR